MEVAEIEEHLRRVRTGANVHLVNNIIMLIRSLVDWIKEKFIEKRSK